MREASEEGRLELTTNDFFTHPSWNPLVIHNDLALVHLPQVSVSFADIFQMNPRVYIKGSKTWYTGKVIAGGTFILHRMPPTIFWKEN